jgi:type IV pilus biogenesis protein CpaD/CtpE
MKTTKTVQSMFVIVVVAFCLSGCASTQSQYDAARKADTIPAYKQFLQKNPTGELAVAARGRIDELVFRSATKTNTIAGYEYFIRHSSNQQLIDEAKKRISEIQAADAERSAQMQALLESYKVNVTTCAQINEDMKSGAWKMYGASVSGEMEGGFSGKFRTPTTTMTLGTDLRPVVKVVTGFPNEGTCVLRSIEMIR